MQYTGRSGHDRLFHLQALGCVITELVTHKHVSDRVPGSSFGRNQGAVAQAVAEVGIKDSALGGLCRLMLESEPARRPTGERTFTLRHSLIPTSPAGRQV